MNSLSHRSKISLLLGISLVAIVAVFYIEPIAQDLQYHQFADQRIFWNIPNTWNVLSNLIFALAGLLGLHFLCVRESLLIVQPAFPAYATFFIALIALAAGSVWYHWSPNNVSLVWDRLPMTLAFMSFFTIILAERLSLPLAKLMFPILLVAGIASVVYWHYSEAAGNGDLRPYALVQFLPLLLVPLILLMFPSQFTRGSDIWWFLAWYLAAKGFEVLDQQIYGWLVLFSGHSLKHIAASLGCLIFLYHLRHRKTGVRTQNLLI
ncbi:MAG: alkaline phytoceramidase [Gammaproteobacteria bacterium]